MLKVILLCLVVTYCTFPVAHGEFQCYSCNMDGGATDRSCMNNPAGVTTSNPVVNCPYKYCSIVRTEYQESGQIFTFHRGCTSRGDEGVSEGGGFKVYTRVCTANLCNYWDGISSSPPGGSGGGGPGGSGDGSGNNGPGNNGPGNNGPSIGFLLVDPDSGAVYQRCDLFVTLIAVTVVMNLYR